MADDLLGIKPTDPLEIKQQQDNDLVATTGSILGAEDALRAIAQSSGYGDIKTAMTAMFLGHNHRGPGNPIPMNNEQYGMTFFTRPRLNLSYDNIKHIRKFTPLLTDNQDSIARALRAYLDPDGSRLYYPSRLVDPLNAFIPLLDNNVITVTGWPDPYVDTYTSKEGLYKEQWSMVDGFADINGVLSLTANFRNLPKDPITYLFHIWTRYAAYVHEGRIDPRPDSILENEIDYNTRPYRLTLDPTRQYVEHIAAPIAAFPKSDSTGAIFNYNEDKPISREVDQVSCEFQAMGMIYHDPILIQEFNDCVCMFNPNMFDGVREKVYSPISAAYKPIFVNVGYPRINPYTSELEWWVAKDAIKAVIRNVQKYPGMDDVSSISPIRR